MSSEVYSPRAPRANSIRGRIVASLAALLAISGVLGASGARAEDAKNAPPSGAPKLSIPAYEKVLQNGLTVLTVERPGTPRAVCWLFYKTGSVNERPGITGISHVFEHLMFKGTHRIGVKDDALDRKIQPQLDALWVSMHDEGASEDSRKKAEGEFEKLSRAEKQNDVKDERSTLYNTNGATNGNAYTTEDATVYQVTLPANRVELFMWLEADQMRDAVFREFYSEREVVKEEMHLDENRPDGPYYTELQALFFMASPYHWPVIGWPSDVDAITPADLRQYFATFYAPNNAVLVCAGAVKHEEIERLAELYFGSIPRGATPPPPVRTREPKPAGERRLTVEAEARPRATLMWHTPKMGDADGPALDVAQSLLGGKTGRLWQELVEKSELCTDTSADYTQHRWAGSFTVEGNAKEKVTPEAVADAMQKVVASLVTTPPTADELAHVKTRLTADLMKKLEEPERFVEVLGWYAALYDWRYLQSLPDLWSKVTADDVKRVAAEYLTKQKRVVGILQEKGSGDEKDEPKEGEKKDEEPAPPK